MSPLISTALTLLLWFCALGCGLMAGLYFAFSAFIMAAFARIEHTQAIAAMKAINRTILGSLFIPLFWGTTLASLALVALAAWHWDGPGAAPMLAGGLIYLAGMFLVTLFANLPLNRALARSEPEQAAAFWSRYLRNWTRWNHLRTLASAAAMLLFIAAIAAG